MSSSKYYTTSHDSISNTIDKEKKQWNTRLNNINRSASQQTQLKPHHSTHSITNHIHTTSTDDSPRSSNTTQHINIVKKKDKQVTPVNDWKPYNSSIKSEQIQPVYENNNIITKNNRGSFSVNKKQQLHRMNTSISMISTPGIQQQSTQHQHTINMHTSHNSDLTNSISDMKIANYIPNNNTSPSMTRQQQYQHYKQQYSYYCNTVQLYMQHKLYIVTLLCITLISLYGKDFNDAVLPPSCDTPTAILLLVIFILFSLEILVNCMTRTHYIYSFYIVLDILGTFSLIFDIYFILNLFWDVNTLNNTQQQPYTNSAGGTSNTSSSTHVYQSASLLQVTKFSRVLRVLRLIRIVRIFKFYSNQQHSSINASKVGLHLSELIDRRVILVLLGILVVCPFLTVTMPTDNSAVNGLLLIQQVSNPSDQQLLISQYLSLQSTCIYLSVNGIVYYNTLSSSTDLRPYELITYTTNSSKAIYSTQSITVLSAIYNISLTTFIILIFGIGIIIVSRDVRQLVVAPLERMTHMIKKLAGTICVLNSDHTNNTSTAAQQSIDTSDTTLHQQSLSETKMIESVIEKMALIFAVQPDATGQGDNKAMSMMAGSKHTEIVTGSSVVSIQVVERPRQNSFDFTDDNSQYSHLQTDELINTIPVDLNQFNELQSIENILNNTPCLNYYKMYMISNLQIENLLFYQEVSRFQSIIQLHTNHLFHNFIGTRATSNAINIPSTLRDSIYHSLCSNYKSSVFDDAQTQVMLLMNGHYTSFIQSKYCQAYIYVRYQQLVARGKIKPNDTIQ